MTDCGSIRERLSAYIDEALSSQEKAIVDEHLKTCRECAAALADMKKVIEHIKGLETVEPPPWLKQKVMAKVRAEAQPKKGLFQKLFYPLQVKLPVGAIATIAIALTTLYIFKTIEPEIKLAKVPIEEAAPQIHSKDATLPSPRGKDELETGKSSPARQPEESKKVLPVSPLLEKEDKGGFAGKAAPAPGKPVEQPTLSEEADLKADKLAQSRVQEARKMEVNVPAPARASEQAQATGALAKGEARQEARAAGSGAKLSYMEKKKEEMLTLSVLVKDPEAAVKEIEKTLKELEGKGVRAESAEGKKIITGEINASKLKELVVRLKAVGKVKEMEVDFESVKGEVKVKVEIVRISEER